MIDILNKKDINIIESLILFDLIGKNIEILSQNDDIPKLQEVSRNDIIINVLKHEYNVNNQLLFENLNVKGIKKFLYNENETKEMLKNHFYQLINQGNIQTYVVNGNNFIGRTLLKNILNINMP